MTTEQGFLDAIRANPDDDLTRLVYADWLDDHSDPHAEYLRSEVELAQLQEEDPRYAEVEVLLRQLRPAMHPEWIAQAGKRFDVVLHGYKPVKKIATIKAIRELSGIALHHGKCLAETLPNCLRPACVRADAEAWRDLLLLRGKDIDVELAATSCTLPAYGVMFGGVTYAERARNCLQELLNNPSSDVAGLLDRLPVVVREGLPLAEAQALLAKANYSPHVHLHRARIGHSSPLPIPPYAVAGAFNVVVLGCEPENEHFVARTLERMRFAGGDLLHGVAERLPLTAASSVPASEALWVWQRFRGRADVRIVPVEG